MYSLVSFLFVVFQLTVPRCPAICKSKGHVPPVPYGVGAGGPLQSHFSENMKAVAAEQRGLALWGPPVNLRTGNKKTNYANSSISHMQNITAGMHEQA